MNYLLVVVVSTLRPKIKMSVYVTRPKAEDDQQNESVVTRPNAEDNQQNESIETRPQTA